MDDCEDGESSLPDRNAPKDFSNPVYRELVVINGRINTMVKSELINNLKRLNLDTNGNVIVMRKRLKNHFKMTKLSIAKLDLVSKLYPFYIVIDFEATCESYNPPDFPHEIIEFPAVLVDSSKQTVVDEFHSFVKPTKNPKLSEFCVKLTGITQETVDNSEEFPHVLTKFQEWLKKHSLGAKHKFAIVTDGPCDMGRFLYGQCNISNVPFPSFAKKWVNLRRVFSSYYRCKKLSLALMLQSFGVEFSGRPHSGLDDARNIAKLLLLMIKDGVDLDVNENLHINQLKGKRNHDRKKYECNHRPRPQQAQTSQEEKNINCEDLEFALGLLSVRNGEASGISALEKNMEAALEES